jgi:hypothetical protein
MHHHRLVIFKALTQNLALAHPNGFKLSTHVFAALYRTSITGDRMSAVTWCRGLLQLLVQPGIGSAEPEKPALELALFHPLGMLNLHAELERPKKSPFTRNIS